MALNTTPLQQSAGAIVALVLGVIAYVVYLIPATRTITALRRASVWYPEDRSVKWRSYALRTLFLFTTANFALSAAFLGTSVNLDTTFSGNTVFELIDIAFLGCVGAIGNAYLMHKSWKLYNRNNWIWMAAILPVGAFITSLIPVTGGFIYIPMAFASQWLLTFLLLPKTGISTSKEMSGFRRFKHTIFQSALPVALLFLAYLIVVFMSTIGRWIVEAIIAPLSAFVYAQIIAVDAEEHSAKPPSAAPQFIAPVSQSEMAKASKSSMEKSSFEKLDEKFDADVAV